MSNKCKPRKYFCDVRLREYNRVATAESGTEVRRTREYLNGQGEDARNILEMYALIHGLFIWT
jgi:hypothetical protein